MPDWVQYATIAADVDDVGFQGLTMLHAHCYPSKHANPILCAHAFVHVFVVVVRMNVCVFVRLNL